MKIEDDVVGARERQDGADDGIDVRHADVRVDRGGQPRVADQAVLVAGGDGGRGGQPGEGVPGGKEAAERAGPREESAAPAETAEAAPAEGESEPESGAEAASQREAQGEEDIPKEEQGGEIPLPEASSEKLEP